jgi:hypothetical protein
MEHFLNFNIFREVYEVVSGTLISQAELVSASLKTKNCDSETSSE